MRSQLTGFPASRLWLLMVCALVVCAPAQVILPQIPPHTGQMPQERMVVVARKLNLGAKRADSEQPRTTANGAGLPGYYQCFERGCVYYSAKGGVRGVKGVIFTKFVAEGYERGPLGFPTTDEGACVPPPPSHNPNPRAYVPSASYQNFEGGSIIVAGAEAGGVATRFSERVGADGICDTRPPAPAPASSGRFRVTINGFACHRPTYDDASQSDGVDDEIYLKAYQILYDLTEHRSQLPAESSVMGDSNGFRERIRAGSGHNIFGGNGGFREGDPFPAGGRPWERTSAPGGDRPPLHIWEGELDGGRNALAIIPSIWEWDSPVHLNREIGNHYTRALAATVNDDGFASDVRRFITGGGSVTSIASGPNLRRLFDGVRMMKDTAGAGSRPVGMVDRGAYYAFAPRALVLTYDSAVRIATSNNNGLGPGVIQLDFRDDDALRGMYSLYIQVERLP
ncbi:MAG: LGFP repeat-containing protein [Pyrinomonadaceae bacterium]